MIPTRVIESEQGALELIAGGDSYRIESSYSHMGTRLGINTPSRQRPVVARKVSVADQKITVADTLTNLTGQDAGIRIHHRITATPAPREVLLAGAPQEQSRLGAAENPSLFLRLAHSGLGVIAEDTISRLQFEGARHDDGASFALNHFALRPGESRTLQWAMYPFAADADYFTFINQVRRDWNTNFTVPGPWSKFDTIGYWDIWHDPARLKAYLLRKRHGFITLSPWLDYDNFNARAGRTMDRGEYWKHMREAIRAFKEAQPDLKCTGCMEGNLVSLPADRMREFYDALPADQRVQGIRPFTDKMMEIVRSVPLRWKDCLLTAPDGRYTYEVYYPRPENPLMAIAVYAAPGNDQLAYWLEQARFMMEMVGFDGVYVDQFNFAFNPNQRYTHDRWDGVTVDLDARTGEIVRRYTDCAFVSIGARKQLVEYVLARGSVMVANTHAAAREAQSFPISRFMEAEWFFNPLLFDDGTEPPLLPELCKAHLGSPLALGYKPWRLGEEGLNHYARVIMKSVITYLRHGVLYYHFRTEMPETGPGSGEYGPINHMFPITPVALHKGWVEGRERIVTAISGSYHWPHDEKPVCHRFGLDGREEVGNISARKSAGG